MANNEKWRKLLGADYYKLGKNEKFVMMALWEGARSTREIYDHYRDHLKDKSKEIAFSTLSTELSRMAMKGFITREKIGDSKEYTFTPLITQEQCGEGELAMIHLLTTGKPLPDDETSPKSVAVNTS